MRLPVGESAVMVITVVCVVATGNLAVGVVVGSVSAMVVFARRVAHLAEVSSVTDPTGDRIRYTVTGALFFASSNVLASRFDYADDPGEVVIDLTAAHIWDASSVAALDGIADRYARHGKTVELVGLNPRSAELHGTLSGQLG